MSKSIDSDDSFEATYATPMHCESCIEAISGTLKNIRGIKQVRFDLSQQVFSVTGVVPPSTIISALESSGRTTILRGSGEANSAAVSILANMRNEVCGLARMVTLSSSKKTFLDITFNNCPTKLYYASIRTAGDTSKGAQSLGDPLYTFDEPIKSNSSFLSASFAVQDIIGRGFLITTNADHTPDEDTLYGVIARSAGAWENYKQVCACSGKTLWEEREAVKREERL